jgi:hypothetical protein
MMTVSLLWPPGQPRPVQQRPWLEGSAADLGLADLLAALGLGPRHQRFAEGVLLELCADEPVITYRQAVLDDLLRSPALTAELEALLPELEELAGPSFRSTQESAFYQAVARLAELESFVSCVRGLTAALTAAGPRSAGWRAWAARLADLQSDPTFRALAAQLPELGAKIRSVQSVTLGVNLDTHLRPVAAALVAINDRPFQDQTLLGRLLGDDALTGLAPLHIASQPAPDANRAARELTDGRFAPLFRDLEEALERVAGPIAKALRRYHAVNVQPLVDLTFELAFFLGAARLVQQLRAAGLPVCLPEVAPAEARVSELRGVYNLHLARRLMTQYPGRDVSSRLVRNEVSLGPDGRLGILTGPNRGGKTTYTQGLGLVHVLFQAGLPVPAEHARLSPIDALYTHFTAEEKLYLDTGRLGEEARRAGEIFRRATRHSLVLFNEAFASTTPAEGLVLARDVVRGLRRLGARGLFTTHFHELAAEAAALNAEAPGASDLVSLVAGAEATADGAEARRTFQIRPGPPLGTSYAREIAVRHGLSLEQIEQTLRDRKLTE